MAKLNRPPVIYSPTTLQDLLRIYSLNEDAVIYAGGTGTLSGIEGDIFQIRGSVINITGIEELRKVSRTDRYLELGAAVTVSRILDLGKTIIPEALYTSLKQMGPPQIRNMATIGGNICRQSETMDIFPVLLLHDAQVELRKHKENRSPRRLLRSDSRWTPVSRLFSNEGKINMEPGEILTRIRIPSDQWTFQSYRKLGGLSEPLIFTAFANMDKYIITDVRICFSSSHEKVVRNRDIEADLIGRRVPLNKKELNQLSDKIRIYFHSIGEEDFTTARALALTNQFLEKISEPVEESVVFQ